MTKAASEEVKNRTITLSIGKSIPGNKLILTLNSKRTENGEVETLFDLIGFIK